MYCTLQYTEISPKESEVKLPQVKVSTSAKSLYEGSTQCLVENKELLINPNCYVGILLDFVCSEIGFDKDTNFDFWDTENGEMAGIKQHPPNTYATNMLKPQHTYFIVFFEKDENGHYTKFEPLINKQVRGYSEILLRMKRKINSSTKRRRSLTTTKKSRKGSSVSGMSYTDLSSSAHKSHMSTRDSMK